MLKQLARLSIEIDGRYATTEELQFLKDYLQTVDQRISAYEKIRDKAEMIMQQVGTKKQALKESGQERLFYLGPNDRSETCLRDMRGILRCSAAAVLFNDLDRMREAVLLWYYTIVRSFQYQKDTATMYPILENIVKEHITSEEAKLARPVFQLNTTILR